MSLNSVLAESPALRRFAWLRALVAVLIGAINVGAQPAEVEQPADEPPAFARSVRLEVRVASWLGSTPFAMADVVAQQLRQADVEVLEDPETSVDAIVQVDYLEDQDDLRHAPGVYGSRVEMRVNVRRSDDERRVAGSTCLAAGPVPEPFPLRPPTNDYLRAKAVAELERRDCLVFFGHWVAASLGVEASIRYLLFGPTGAYEHAAGGLVLRELEWRPDNDHLFERVAVSAKIRGSTGMAAQLGRYVQERTSHIERDESGRPQALRSILAAMEALGSLGRADAATFLERLAAGTAEVIDPAISDAARTEARYIRARLARQPLSESRSVR